MKLFGWHDIVCSLPEGWELGKIDGSREKGYIRIDDVSMARMEVRWETTKGEVDIRKIVDEYLKKTMKVIPSKDIPVQRNLNLSALNSGKPAAVSPYVYEYFAWENDVSVRCLVRYCRECSRAVFVTVFSRKDENNVRIAEDIFCSLKDHPEDNISVWGAFDLLFRIPGGFSLKDHSFRSGHIRLSFNMNAKDMLYVDRISLADVILNTRSLESWYQEFFRKDLSRYRYTVKTAQEDAGKVVYINGREKVRVFPKIQIWNLQDVRAVVWHNKSDNKIYAVSLVSRNNDDEAFTMVRDSITNGLC